MSRRPPTEADIIADEVFHSYPPPRKYRGLERAAHVGQLIAEDVRAGELPLWRTLRDVMNDNDVCFDPPYPKAKLIALAKARCEAEGIPVDDE